MTSHERWLAETWPYVQAQLPRAPATALEIGCGPLGGFVPALLEAGYDAAGVDPEAPDGHAYHQIEFERFEVPGQVDAVIACTSLHHVADLDLVLDRVAKALAVGGTLVVIEWARELFDEPTAQWCFARLAPAASEGEHGWLRNRRDEHAASGQSWDAYCRSWAEQEGLHTGEEIVRGLDARFDGRSYADGPYFFPDLDGVSQADEQAAIDSGQIRATGIRYTGTGRSR
jgi:SAM-dependent methyltransferase